MRIKKQFYPVNGTMALTMVLYKNDLDWIDKNNPRLLEVIGNDDNSVNVLHGLIVIAEKLERRNEQTKVHPKQAEIPGVS